MLPEDRLAYDPQTMMGLTDRDRSIIAKALESNRKLKVDVVDTELRVIDCSCFIASAVHIRYDPRTMEGKTARDEAAIKNALAAGRDLRIRKEGDEIKVIDVICFIASAVYKNKDDYERLPSP